VSDADETDRLFDAYELHDGAGLRLMTAPATREWMTNTPQRFANRCLPLLMANQAGWLVLSVREVQVTWNGDDDLQGVDIRYQGDVPLYPARSHFGCGIVTWNLPWVFRTPPGCDLLVRGPANWPKDGAAPLEGLVETDWSAASFTMNWKLTRPGLTVTFHAGDPLCMLVPQKGAELEAFTPRLYDAITDSGLRHEYETWAAARGEFLRDLTRPGSAAAEAGWQKDYFQGRRGDGSRHPTHRTRLHLREFERIDPSP
jgi:hypothetical protein